MVDGWTWLTPPAPAAIALLRAPWCEKLFDRSPPAVGSARFANICALDGHIIDEVVVTRVSATTVEIACHGGPGIRAAVEAALIEHGLLPSNSIVEDPRWSALAQAASPAAVRWLLAHGDNAPPFQRRFLSHIPLVLITGPTNAGKSTLLNAWCGQQRALVSDIAGTTRDLVAAQTIVHGWRLRLLDSAGLRHGGDALERAGQALVAQARRAADVVLYLQPPNDENTPEVGDLIVHGKADLAVVDGLCWSVHGVAQVDSATLLDHIGRAVLGRLKLPV
jgi:tRNA U34 5-carboxymethylaminomethyl modifying GTPase MnmE/TrmE